VDGSARYLQRVRRGGKHCTTVPDAVQCERQTGRWGLPAEPSQPAVGSVNGPARSPAVMEGRPTP
jgi:hypothetical protein